MKPSELADQLRRGNLLLTGSLQVVKVLSIMPDSTQVEGELEHTMVVPYSALSPIPLDAEWLERLGFVNRYGKETFNVCYGIELADRSGRLQVKSGFIDNEIENYHIAQNDAFIANAAYVHQLQNLYYCLIGTELTTKKEI